MNKRIWLVAGVTLPLFLGAAAPEAWALKLSATAIYFEINDTDGDAGVQIFLDGEGWDTMQVTDPTGTTVLGVAGSGGVGQQGITELFLESAEPSFEVQSLEELLELFPAGRYVFRGSTTEGELLTGTARLSHALPEAPEIISPAEDELVDADNAVVEWELVPNPAGSRIMSYQVIIAREEPSLRVYQIDLGRRQSSVVIPAEFLRSGREYKGEVIAIERTGNRTITEFEFETE